MDGTGAPVITCPIRFRQDWRIAQDAATFFFPPQSQWASLSEIRLNNREGVSAGNVDLILVAFDDSGAIIDFGAVEIQAVYISGNVREVFDRYVQDPASYSALDWSQQTNSPRPDFASSSRKRLAPQLLYKGGILHAWGKKQAVALDSAFFKSLPTLPEVSAEQAEIAWLVYDLEKQASGQMRLHLARTVYTRFEPALSRMITTDPGNLADFMTRLQSRLDKSRDE